jgi:hypothetical protein
MPRRRGGLPARLRKRPWWCSCPAKTTCSHLYALWAVTVREAAA